MEIIYKDPQVLVCIKPQGVLSTDEPGGLPDLLRQELGDANVRTVHRLDRVVGGLMVLGRTARAASDLSREIREGGFEKEYLAVLHGVPQEPEGILRDLLLRDPRERKTYVVTEPQKDAQEAILHYRVLEAAAGLSLVKIQLVTGRTHQIRAQFSSRGLPLVGDRKYGVSDGADNIALWSCRLAFHQPKTGQRMEFTGKPPEAYPWTEFSSRKVRAAAKA